MTLSEYESILKTQLAKLDGQFIEMDEELKNRRQDLLK